MKHLYILLFLAVIVSCKQNKNDIYGHSYKIYAADPGYSEPLDVCLDKAQTFSRNKFHLKEGQLFYEVSMDNMLKAKGILCNLIDSCRKIGDENTITPSGIGSYFRQYIGYKEKNINYVYINLCAFYVEQHKQPGVIISDNFFQSILSTPERGYAGHVIIDMDKLTVKEYHFEEFPEIEE